jgi:hypothetical protein
MMSDRPSIEQHKLDMQIPLRVTKDLHEALKEDAEANGRTVSQSVRWHLTNALLRFMAGDCERDCLEHCAGLCGNR